MEIIKGKFTEAKVFSEDLEQYARAQLQMICDNAIAENSTIRVMPDVHPGKVGTIGLTMTVGNKIMPNLLGIDIGCGMTCVELKEKRMEFQKLDKLIAEKVPSGFSIRKNAHHLAEEFDFTRFYCYKHIHQEKAKLSLGSLGGGNHFIEVDKSDDGRLYLVVHSGSRHLGKEVTEYYISEGAKVLKDKGLDVSQPLTWLEGKLMEQYVHDVEIAQEFAMLNREIIVAEIVKGMKLKVKDNFFSVHNYLDVSDGMRILRKGAISAQKGQRVIIPINMKDGVILGVGKGNVDWNLSVPHGSGRKLRRDEVKNQYTVSAFKNEMKGIYCSCIGADTLDEAPFAYRSVEQLMEGIKETVEVTEVLKTVYNFKAGGKHREEAT